MPTSTRSTAARAFVRSLNILLKFSRMYDFGHPRTKAQYATAWTELKTALGHDDEAGLLLSVSGDQLLLDGVALESAAAEKSFARLLSAAGIASIHFSPKVTQASLARMVKAFPTGVGAKPTALAEQLKAALEGDTSITINEICYVPADSAVAKGTVAATLAAHTLGMEAGKYNELFNDPQKLLQLITAAEGSRGPSGSGSGGSGSGGSGSGGSGSGYGGEDSGGGSGFGSGGGGFGDGGGSGVGGNGVVVPGAPSFGLSWLESGGANSSGPGGHGGGGFPGGFPGNAGAAGSSGEDSGWIGPIGSGGGSGSGTGSGSGSGPGGASGPGLGPGLGPGSGRGGGRGARGGSGTVLVESGLVGLQEDELRGILKMLSQIASIGGEADADTASTAFQSRISTLPRRARFSLTQALSAIAQQVPSQGADQSTLLRLAEHIAIRFAMESYERGDTHVDSVRQMLDSMGREIDGLRKVLSKHEDKLLRAGVNFETHTEVLTRQFWSEVPHERRMKVLLSPEAWCIPVANVSQSVEELISKGEKSQAQEILENYAKCIRNEKPEARRAIAMGIVELAGHYGDCEERVFLGVIREVGLQLSEEKIPELQSLVGAAFVRLSQEAGQRRSYTAMQRAVEMVDYIEGERKSVGKNIRPRIEVENRLAEFIDEAVKTGNVPNGLTAFMRRIPGEAAEVLAGRFSRSGFREDSELLLGALKTLGPEAVNHLRETLHNAPAAQAVDTVAALARLDLAALEIMLPSRMKEWKRSTHDRVIRQLAASGAPERGRVMLSTLDSLDPLVQPLAIDEIGLSGEHEAESRLLRIAEGDLPPGTTAYLQLKAIEALGRLRTSSAQKTLRRIVEGKQVWRWQFPAELRIVAAQALEKIDPDWAKDYLPKSGLSVAELAIQPLDVDAGSNCIRQRRYPRMRLDHSLSGETMNLKENCEIQIPEMNLGGGVTLSEQSLHPGTIVALRLNPANQKPVKAQAIVRDANTQARAFEVVDMDLEDRAKLRRLLVQIGKILTAASPEKRSRKRGRTIVTSS